MRTSDLWEEMGDSRPDGPITDLEVTRIPNRAIDTGVLGIFQRTLELPAGILLGRERAPEEESSAEEEPSGGPDSSD